MMVEDRDIGRIGSYLGQLHLFLTVILSRVNISILRSDPAPFRLFDEQTWIIVESLYERFKSFHSVLVS